MPRQHFCIPLWSLVPASTSMLFLFAFEISQEFPVQPSWPPAIPAQHPEHQDGLFLRFEEAVLEDQATFMGLSALQGRLPGDSAYQFLEQAEVRTLEVLSDYYITCLSHFPQVLKQPSRDTAAKSPQNSSSLFVSSTSSTVLPSVSSSSTSIKKLFLTRSVSLLNCLCPITLPFQQMGGGLWFS